MQISRFPQYGCRMRLLVAVKSSYIRSMSDENVSMRKALVLRRRETIIRKASALMNEGEQ